MPAVRFRTAARALAPLAAAVALAAAPPALASLGDEVASVERDRAVLNGVTQVSAGDGYEVHEIAHASGSVRQYVAGGRVFAVTWEGSAVPDLALLLGDYHPRYASLIVPQPGNHHVVSVAANGLSVHTQTILRSHRGQVVATSIAPPKTVFASLR